VRRTRYLACLGGLALVVACGSPPPSNAKYPPRPEGCDVRIYPDIPPGQTDNIGPVQASCDESISNTDCLRTLRDQACKLGADVIWGVDDVPKLELGKKKFSGRAAHTRVPK
jgi:hypothetical protein